MDYKNLQEDNGLYLYNTDYFVSNSCKLYFNIANDIKTLFTGKILKTMLFEDNLILGKRDEIINKAQMLYGLSISTSIDNIGSKLFFKLSFEYLDGTIVQDNYSNDVFNYVNDFINKVNLNKEALTSVKKKVLINITNNLTNKDYLVNSIYYKKEISTSLESKIYINDLDEASKLLDSITLNDVINLYNNIFSDKSFYRGYVIGKYSDDEYKKLRTVIPYKSNMPILDYNDTSITCNYDIDIKNESFNESILRINYEYNNHNNKFTRTLSMMLNSNIGLLHEILRTKYGLVYVSGAEVLTNNSLISIISKINKTKKEETIKAVDEVFELLHNPEKVQYYLDYIKEFYQDLINTLIDNRRKFTNYIESYILKNGNNYDLYEYYDFICNYTPEEFIKELNNIKKINVFFYEGGK